MDNRTCDWCGESIEHRTSRARYCGKSCRAKHSRQLDPSKHKAYQAKYRASPRGKATKARERLTRLCVICGKAWQTARHDGKYCSAACRGLGNRQRADSRRGYCHIPADHPAMRALSAIEQADREAAVEARALAAAASKSTAFAWRTERTCPGCAAIFVPIYTPNTITCSARCQRRVSRWRRRAAEANAYGSFTWVDFMRVAKRFDFRCAYCEKKPAGQLDPDHVVPLSRGGANTVANLLPSCRACNGDKRDLLLSEWNADRLRRGLEPRTTSWAADDRRVMHLTSTPTLANAA